MTQPITYIKATSEEIERLVKMIATHLSEEDPNHVNIACLATAIILQVPEVKPQELVTAVKGASEWISMYGASLRSPKEQMN